MVNIWSILKNLANKTSPPSQYEIWESTFEKLQEEKKLHGRSVEYWRLWYEEVCPAYREMTESNRKLGLGNDALTNHVLQDMDKPIHARKHF